MKFSILATALLAQGIAAMPWSSHKVNGEEITIRIQVSGASGQGLTHEPVKAIHNASPGPCFAVCWPEKPGMCPESWDPTNVGTEDQPCWTCCHKGNDDDL